MANDGFVVPNAPDASVFDQAEPDSLDFLVIGNRRSGVVAGGVVTPLNASSVTVSDVSVVSFNIYGEVAGGPVAVTAADAANPRFDLVIVRRNEDTGVFSLLTLVGPTNLNTNPRFPSVGTTADRFNPITDVLIAALYRAPGTSVQAGDIVDKRVFLGGVVTRKGAAAPLPALGREGEVYYRTGTMARGQSSFYIRDATGWQNLMVFDPSIFVPVGTVITYAGRTGRTPDPDYYMLCDGSYISMAAYPELYDEIGDSFGPITGGNFPLPNMVGRYSKGGTAPGAGGGANTFQLTPAHMPRIPLSGSVGGASVTTSTDTSPPLGHTVSGVTQNHGHLMEHTHISMLFAYPFGGPYSTEQGVNLTPQGTTRGYYHLYESLCNGSHGQAGIHVGVIGNRWNTAQHNLDQVWEDYIAQETKEFTSGIHTGQIPAQSSPGQTAAYSSGDHAHVVDPHPGRSHAHTVQLNVGSLSLNAIGNTSPADINLNPAHTVFRHYIKYR